MLEKILGCTKCKAEEGAPHQLMTEEQKYYVSEVTEFSWTSIRSNLSDAGVSISSKTIRSRLEDL
ncbi:UNVERIFIED_CONTAM: hypothetical protein NCL1_15163 [Trichonephila clavipes]